MLAYRKRNWMIPTAFGLTIGLTLGNFLYQALTRKNNWQQATERSFFQLIAIVTFLVLLRVQGS